MYKAITGGKTFEIESEDSLSLNGKPVSWDVEQLGEGRYHIIRENRSYNVEVLEEGERTIRLRVNNEIIDVETRDKMDLLLERLGMDKALEDVLNDVRAPMPGLILNVEVKEGQQVSKGDPLMILEAMKMENVIKAAGDGTVSAVKVSEGDTVEKNQVLIQF